MKRLLILFTIFGTLLIKAEIKSINIKPPSLKKNIVGNIKILDQKELIFERVGRKKFSEISDLAFLKKRHWLFMLSDKGKIFRFKANFTDKIQELRPLDGNGLKDSDGKKLKKWRRDSEGMDFDDKGRLFISFEEKPRITQISYDGRILKQLKLPYPINQMKNFHSKNKGLEALVWHPKYGLVTAGEYPLKNSPKDIQTLYSLDGKRWRFRRSPESKSALTALEVLDNGNFLILERSVNGFFSPIIITLRELKVENCSEDGLCPTNLIARFDSSKGWVLDNFEGLTKVGKDKFLMISDDNDKFYQKTLFIYFKVISNN